MIGVGLIGLGEIGQVHLEALRSAPGGELVAVCDLDRRLLDAAGPGPRAYLEASELIADPRVDAVDVCLPHHLHAPVALAALAAGKHVLLEKPLARSTAECDEILAAATAAGRTVGVSHNQLLFEPHRRLAELIAAGELGKVRLLRAHLAIGGKYGTWRARPELAGGGLLSDAGVHRVYVLRRLGGEVAAVSASMDAPGEEDMLAVTFELESGALAVIDACYHAPAGVFDDRVEVTGTEGLARVGGCEAFFERFAHGPQLELWRDGAWRPVNVEDGWRESVVRSVQSFVAAVAEGCEPPVPGTEGRRVVELIEAAYASAREGRRVPTPAS